MSDAVLGAVISAVIAGVFGLISKRMEITHSPRSTLTHPIDVSTQRRIENNDQNGVVPTSVRSVDYGKVLKHVGVLQLCLNLVGFLLGVSLGFVGVSENALIAAVLVVGTIVLTVGYWISGSVVARSILWTHLLYVAIGTIIVTVLLNSLLLQQPITGLTLIVSAAQNLAAMFIAGVVLSALKRN